MPSARLAEKMVEQVLKSNIRTVALQNNLTEDVVARMIKDVAEEKLEEKPKNLKKLGLDEIALVTGEHFESDVVEDERVSCVVPVHRLDSRPAVKPSHPGRELVVTLQSRDSRNNWEYLDLGNWLGSHYLYRLK